MDRVRRILHVDMDAFFASVEQRDDPRLRGRPVAVGGEATRRGVVAAASYEARVFGVRSAMPMARALRLCPELVVVPPDIKKYRAVSEQVFTLFREVTPLVEGLSLDEAYLDVTENAWGLRFGVEVARRIKDEIRARTGLTASAGVAPNKFVAKIASGWKKPDGLTVIPPDRVEAFLEQLPVDALWGVGPVTAGKLRARGIERLTDVRTADRTALREAVGSFAEMLVSLAHGIDEREVEPHRERKSYGTENTFDKDLVDVEHMRELVAEMARETARHLERASLYARTVTLKVRYADFSTVTRSESRTPATRDPAELAERAVALLDRTKAGKLPVRLLGVSLQGLATEPDAPAREPGRDAGGDPRQLVFDF
ncbi:MAG TPA: DNA polymerase IV [Polyangia bacterium]|nr:DNA polymerase IV [Polyangia bacterium]